MFIIFFDVKIVLFCLLFHKLNVQIWIVMYFVVATLTEEQHVIRVVI